MRFNLNPEMEAMIREHVESGLFHSPGAVVREAFRLLQGYLNLERRQVP